MPRISVCIPTYNTARYLSEAIESVLVQSASDYELVVCDNASTDETPDICGRYCDPRVRYVRFEDFVGQSANWNRCLKLPAGKYVVLLHADDALRPDFLKRAAEVLDHNPAVGLVHCSVQHIDQSGALLNLQTLYDDDRLESGEVLFKRLLLEGCVVNPAGVMVRREIYDELGPFTEDIVWGVDWHMWMRVALHSQVAYLTEPLALYRQHPQSGTSGVMATARNGKDEMWMLDDIFRQVPASRADIHSLYQQARRQSAHRTWCFAEEMCRSGFSPSARAGIRRAVSIYPAMLFSARVWALWAATYLGYGWFQRLHTWKNELAPSHTAPPLNGKQL
jgi:glycosyltransferase involved in cell wall biosynthesis